MKTILSSIVVILFLSTGLLSAQSDTTKSESTENEIFTIVEVQPEFPGGDVALMKYLTDNLHYPEKAKNERIEGTVYINFVVEADGRISNAKVLRGIGGGCDEVALSIIEKMPNWEPGSHRAKAVRVMYNIPIRFDLGDDSETKPPFIQ